MIWDPKLQTVLQCEGKEIGARKKQQQTICLSILPNQAHRLLSLLSPPLLQYFNVVLAATKAIFFYLITLLSEHTRTVVVILFSLTILQK